MTKLGPGLITGAADDDPSGIATYAQGGTQFGYSLLWTLFLTYPLMVGIQVVSARIGRVSGYGLAGNIRRHYSKALLYSLVTLLLVANTINIGADLSAMADAATMLVGGSRHAYILGFGMFCVLLQVFFSYARYVRVLKWLTLSLFAYVGVVFAIDLAWLEVAKGAFIPSLQMSADYLMAVVAILGTTISPYLFFWQASQEVEEQRATEGDEPLRDSSKNARAHLRRIKIDTWFGMVFSNLIALAIMVTTAVTLHNSGITDIQTSAQAAQALRPIAGDFAFVLFAAGIIGTGVLAIPVLAGSAAYAVAEAMKWPIGHGLEPAEAKGFYSIIALATLLGAGIDFTPIDPIKALIWSAVLNGIIAVPIMAVMMRMAVRPDIMGTFTITPRLQRLGWFATVVMAIAVAAMLASFAI